MRRLITLLFILSLFAHLPAHARASISVSHSAGSGFQPETSIARIQQSKVSLDEAVSIARSKFGGKVVNAQTRRKNGRAIHHVKLLSDSGRVRTVKVDGDSGRIL